MHSPLFSAGGSPEQPAARAGTARWSRRRTVIGLVSAWVCAAALQMVVCAFLNLFFVPDFYRLVLDVFSPSNWSWYTGYDAVRQPPHVHAETWPGLVPLAAFVIFPNIVLWVFAVLGLALWMCWPFINR